MSQDSLNERQFGDYKLRYERPDMDIPRHRIVATKESGALAGHLQWHPKTHEVTTVNVFPEEQRKGLATAMWKMGQEVRPKPVHSADRTRAGDTWAKKVGGRLPRRRKVYDPMTQREV